MEEKKMAKYSDMDMKNVCSVLIKAMAQTPVQIHSNHFYRLDRNEGTNSGCLLRAVPSKI